MVDSSRWVKAGGERRHTRTTSNTSNSVRENHRHQLHHRAWLAPASAPAPAARVSSTSTGLGSAGTGGARNERRARWEDRAAPNGARASSERRSGIYVQDGMNGMAAARHYGGEEGAEGIRLFF